MRIFCGLAHDKYDLVPACPRGTQLQYNKYCCFGYAHAAAAQRQHLAVFVLSRLLLLAQQPGSTVVHVYLDFVYVILLPPLLLLMPGSCVDLPARANFLRWVDMLTRPVAAAQAVVATGASGQIDTHVRI